MSLFWRVVIVNAALVVGAVLVLVVTPASVSAAPTAAELEVLVAGTVLVIALNVLLLRRIFVPLERLTGTMRRVDPHDPGRRRRRSASPPPRWVSWPCAFNDMLDRLEAERQGSARRALAATEAERVRVARELHDQVGQTLTGVVLALEEIHRRAPADLGEDLAEVQEAARAGVEQVREIARGLRPGALEELGLRSALTTLANSFTGLRVRHSLPPDLPVLSPDQDLAVYRVAQESLTNVARHARAGAGPARARARRTARSCCACPTTASASRRCTPRPPRAASAGCASGRCWPAGACGCARCPSAAPR